MMILGIGGMNEVNSTFGRQVVAHHYVSLRNRTPRLVGGGAFTFSDPVLQHLTLPPKHDAS